MYSVSNIEREVLEIDGSKVSENIFASITNSQKEPNKDDVTLEEYQYLNLIQNILRSVLVGYLLFTNSF
jgi:hypothetical protein